MRYYIVGRRFGSKSNEIKTYDSAKTKSKSLQNKLLNARKFNPTLRIIQASSAKDAKSRYRGA